MIEIIVSSSVLIVLLCILRFALKGKISASLQYALWGLVVLRLLIPGSLVIDNLYRTTSPVSVMNVVNNVQEQVSADDYQQPENSSPDMAAAQMETGTLKAAPIIDWNQIFMMVWGLGTAVIMIWMIFVNISFRRYLRKNRKQIAVDAYTMPVYVVPGLRSPCLFGFFRHHAVYVTPEAAENPACLHHVLVHEDAHLQHLDDVWSLVRCLLTAVYWFNPLVWIAALLSKKDCELACDEAVIRRLGETERIHYGETLITLVTNRQQPSDFIRLATGMSSNARGIRERIKRVAQKPRIFGAASVAAILMAAVFMFFTFTSAAKEPTKIVEGISQKGYTNMALFGLDMTNGDNQKNARSDTIMILSMNQDTGECKLLSVNRNTYLNIGNDVYGKANSAYTAGGPIQAVNMLNMNTDLNISEYITIDLEDMVDVVETLGGVMIDVDEEEIAHLNNYQIGLANQLNRSYTAVTTAGNQLLNGMQATAYCRIRYTKGEDFMREERQRKVFQVLAEKVGKADSKVLGKLAEKVLPNVSSTLDLSEFKNLLTVIGKNGITDTAGFPIEEKRATVSMGSKGSCTVPNNLAENVEWVHNFLFGEKNYTISDTINQYSKKIIDEASKFDAVQFNGE